MATSLSNSSGHKVESTSNNFNWMSLNSVKMIPFCSNNLLTKNCFAFTSSLILLLPLLPRLLSFALSRMDESKENIEGDLVERSEELSRFSVCEEVRSSVKLSVSTSPRHWGWSSVLSTFSFAVEMLAELEEVWVWGSSRIIDFSCKGNVLMKLLLIILGKFLLGVSE